MAKFSGSICDPRDIIPFRGQFAQGPFHPIFVTILLVACPQNDIDQLSVETGDGKMGAAKIQWNKKI